MNNYDVVAEIRADLKNYTSNVNEAIDEMKQLEQQTSGSTSKISSFTKGLGTAMIGAGAAVTAMGVKSLTGFGNFQASLNKAAVVAGGTSKDIGGLADVANRMGAELPLSAQDAADAMVQMAQDGASLSTIKEEFPSIAKAATAAGADLQATAGTVQVAMNIWGDSIGSSAQAAAVLTETANVSNASIEDMQQAFADVGSMAASLGINMQDTATAIGMVTNSGVPAAQAAQDLNFALTKMVKPSKAAAGVAKELGISYYDANGKMKSLPDILKQVSSATSGLSEKQRQNYLVTMYGTAGYKAINPLLKAVSNTSGKTSQSWDAMSKAINGASSSTAAANKVLNSQAKDMQQNIGSKIEQVGGNWESLSNKAAAASGGVTGALLDMTNGALSWAQTSNNGIAKFTRGFIGLAPVIGPATTAVGTFVRSSSSIAKAAVSAGKGIINMTKSATGIITKLLGIGTAGQAAGAGERAAGSGAKSSAKDMLAMGAAVLEIGAGIGLATAGIAALVLAITQLAKAGDQGVIALTATTLAIGALAAIFAVLGPALTAGAVGIGVFGAAVLAIGVGIGAASAGIAKLITAITTLGSNLSLIVPTLTAVGVGFASMITGFVTTLAANTPKVSAALMNMLTSFMEQLAAAVPKVSNSALQMMTGFLSAVANNIGNVVNSAINVVVNFVTAIASRIGDIIAAGTNLLVKFVEGITQTIPKIVPAVVNLITTFINTIADQLGNIINSAVKLLVSFISGITKSIPKVVPAVVNLITTFINSVADQLPKIINAAINLIGKFIVGLVKAIPKIADYAVKAVMKFVEGVGYALGKVLSSGSDLINHFITGVVRGVSGSKSAGQKNGDAVKNVLKSVNLFSIGKDIIAGLASGIGSMAGAVWRKVQDIADGISSGMKKLLGIHSPSRVMRNEIGKFIPLGLAQGINAKISAVSAAANDMATAAVPSISMGDIAGTINSANRQLNEGMTASVQGQLSVSQRPLNVSMNVNGTEWRGFVADITNTQDVQLQLQS